MAEITHDGAFAVPPNILLQQLPDQTIIFLDLDTEEYFGLDEVGTRMYEALLAEGSTGAARSVLLDEYDVDEQTLRRDLDAFVAQLLERGLLARRTQ